MWSTVMEVRRPSKFDVVRQKLIGAPHDGETIEISDHGGITIGYSSSVPSAADATKIALGKFEQLMLAAKLTLKPYAIRTHPSGAQPMPRLVGASEVALILGVTKARVSQLTRSEGFPAPIAKLAMGPVYLERSIQAYGRSREEAVHRREVAKLRIVMDAG